MQGFRIDREGLRVHLGACISACGLVCVIHLRRGLETVLRYNHSMVLCEGCVSIVPHNVKACQDTSDCLGAAQACSDADVKIITNIQVFKGSCTDTLTYFIHRIHICQVLSSVDGIMSRCTVGKDIDKLLIQVLVIVKELLMPHIPLIIVCRSCPFHCCHLKDKFRMFCCC